MDINFTPASIRRFAYLTQCKCLLPNRSYPIFYPTIDFISRIECTNHNVLIDSSNIKFEITNFIDQIIVGNSSDLQLNDIPLVQQINDSNAPCIQITIDAQSPINFYALSLNGSDENLFVTMSNRIYLMSRIIALHIDAVRPSNNIYNYYRLPPGDIVHEYGDKFDIYFLCNDETRTINTKILNMDNFDEEMDTYKRQMSACVSGGVTISNPGKFKIILTKREECSKLLLHELVHYYSLDELGDLSHNNNESYAELTSIILHCIFMSKEKSNSIDYDLFDLFMNIELNYSLYLTAKLLYFYGYNSKTYRDYFVGKHKLHQPIYFTEYIITRGIMFYHLNQIINPSTVYFIDGVCLFATHAGLNPIVKGIIANPGNEYLDAIGRFMLSVETNDDMSMCYICMDPMY
jgi:hypothetical protein